MAVVLGCKGAGRTMDIYQLKIFSAVAHEGSITRASELLHLSQPAVSAHIKALEDALGLALFERTSRGMSLTRNGERLRAKAEQILAAHQELLDEATRLKGRCAGVLRLGAASNLKNPIVEQLLAFLSERCPDAEVVLTHGTSLEISAGIRNGSLDAGFYHDVGEPDAALASVEASQFRVYLAAAPGLVEASGHLDWSALAALPWIYPTSSACCGQTAESLFKLNQIRPQRIISVDREDVTCTLVARGLGVGLLHADTAKAARERREVELLFESQAPVRVLFAHLANRAQDPLLVLATSMVRSASAS